MSYTENLQKYLKLDQKGNMYVRIFEISLTHGLWERVNLSSWGMAFQYAASPEHTPIEAVRSNY